MIDNVKVVILAGGLGTRLGEETALRPKPMVEIGGRPILWHIMKHYSHYGFTNFVICLGHKGEYIKRYFADLISWNSDMTVDLRAGAIERHDTENDGWRVTLVDTGQSTQTGGRMLRVRDLLDDTFLMTYGDGVSDVDLTSLLQFHREHGRAATVTAVRPPARFGQLHLGDDHLVEEFEEKPTTSEGWINGGFFVLEPSVFDSIPGDVDWAKEPMAHLAASRQLVANCHDGFWQCMDTPRDRNYLEQLWETSAPPWKVWR